MTVNNYEGSVVKGARGSAAGRYLNVGGLAVLLGGLYFGWNVLKADIQSVREESARTSRTQGVQISQNAGAIDDIDGVLTGVVDKTDQNTEKIYVQHGLYEKTQGNLADTKGELAETQGELAETQDELADVQEENVVLQEGLQVATVRIDTLEMYRKVTNEQIEFLYSRMIPSDYDTLATGRGLDSLTRSASSKPYRTLDVR